MDRRAFLIGTAALAANGPARAAPTKSLEDLKGKKFAVAKGSRTDLLVTALESAGLDGKDIEPVDLGPADAGYPFHAMRPSIEDYQRLGFRDNGLEELFWGAATRLSKLDQI